MENDNPARVYWIWGIEYAAHGPVELPQLIEWIKDERVLADSWVYRDPDNTWNRAGQVPELKMFFPAKGDQPGVTSTRRSLQALSGDIPPAALRRMKVFADMSDQQLERFVDYMEIVSVAKNARLITRRAWRCHVHDFIGRTTGFHCRGWQGNTFIHVGSGRLLRGSIVVG
jgi:hypothetical protein